MSVNPRDQDNFNSPGLRRLGADLRRLHDARIAVPPATDESIRQAARVHLRSPAIAARRALPRTLWWSAAAAAVVVATLLSVVWQSRPMLRHTSAIAAVPGDFDRSGRLDILDAFLLARQLQRGQQPAEADLNRDGAVDRRDVDVLASRAVQLPKGVS